MIEPVDEVLNFFNSFLNQTKSINFYQSFIQDSKNFISAINWSEDYWIFFILFFHFIFFLIGFKTRKNINLQATFLILNTILIFFSENLNSILSLNFKIFSTQNYFDKTGVFIGIFFSGPLIFISIFIIISTLKQVSNLLIKVKRNQLKREQVVEEKKKK